MAAKALDINVKYKKLSIEQRLEVASFPNKNDSAKTYTDALDKDRGLFGKVFGFFKREDKRSSELRESLNDKTQEPPTTPGAGSGVGGGSGDKY
jgi:hypothetical protein